MCNGHVTQPPGSAYVDRQPLFMIIRYSDVRGMAGGHALLCSDLDWIPGCTNVYLPTSLSWPESECCMPLQQFSNMISVLQIAVCLE